MAIIGIGTDIININRIEKLSRQFGARFLNRIFTPHEQAQAQKYGNAAAFYAKRFAAKEAFVKALGCGMGAKASWKEIEVQNNAVGAPFLHITGQAQTSLSKKATHPVVHLSLSDDTFAVAFVIIEEKA